MKLLGYSQLKEADQITVKNQNISFLDLMERAGTAIFKLIDHRLKGAPVPIHIFCGLGNNGGDGLVIARHLIEHGYHVTTYIVNFSSNRSEAFLKNFDRLKEIGNDWPIQLKSEKDFPVIKPNEIIIDAIFGIGLSRPIDRWVKKLIQYINKSQSFVIAVDIPSGLCLGKAPEDKEAVIYANSCLTFQLPKLVFYLPETAIYVQDVEVLDIGLDKNYLASVKTGMELIGKPEVLTQYKPRQKFSHKGTYGHALVIGGSKGKIGSVILASKGCLRSGVGLITALAPDCGYEILQTAVPELMLVAQEEDDIITSFKNNIKANVICVGMGMGKNTKTLKAFTEFLKTNNLPLVLDADALNLLSENQDLLQFLPEKTILTPHPKELERLIGKWNDDFEKIEKTKEFSEKYNCIILIKGAHTITVYKQNIYINTTGNPGMATAGMGDVLSGIITSFVAQGYDPLQAAIFGVYLHGSAADIALNSLGYQSMIATDIVEHLGKAFLELFKRNEPQQTQKQ